MDAQLALGGPWGSRVHGIMSAGPTTPRAARGPLDGSRPALRAAGTLGPPPSALSPLPSGHKQGHPEASACQPCAQRLLPCSHLARVLLNPSTVPPGCPPGCPSCPMTCERTVLYSPFKTSHLRVPPTTPGWVARPRRPLLKLPHSQTSQGPTGRQVGIVIPERWDMGGLGEQGGLPKFRKRNWESRKTEAAIMSRTEDRKGAAAQSEPRGSAEEPARTSPGGGQGVLPGATPAATPGVPAGCPEDSEALTKHSSNLPDASGKQDPRDRRTSKSPTASQKPAQEYLQGCINVEHPTRKVHGACSQRMALQTKGRGARPPGWGAAESASWRHSQRLVRVRGHVPGEQ